MNRLLCGLFAGLMGAGCAPTDRTPPPPVRRVVLVHGFLETGSAFKPLARRLAKHHVQCLVPKLHPCDARGGLEPLAAGLKRDIDAAFGPHQRISIVAFSMGGLVARYYLQNLGGASRCDQLITIATPHHGTDAAYYYPSKGTRQMRPGSRFLTDIRRGAGRLDGMRLVSYRTPLDLVVYPPESAVWDRAENLSFPVLLHHLMLKSNAVLSDVERRLLE